MNVVFFFPIEFVLCVAALNVCMTRKGKTRGSYVAFPTAPFACFLFELFSKFKTRGVVESKV